MRTRRLLWIASFLLLLQCDDHVFYHGDDALLRSYDFRYCACCGGTFVEIHGTLWRFQNTPRYSDITLDAQIKFPMKVHVLWKKASSSCMGDLIEVSELYQVR